ncbi:hypothetical protein AUF62_01755 [archaeon 13_1_20CM_52_20]|nr:MAG: hypothetical protein AUF62_01755 [archaeon 13_1_20CM_52_20]
MKNGQRIEHPFLLISVVHEGKTGVFLGKAVFHYSFGFTSIAELDGCIRGPAQSDHIKRPQQQDSSSQGSLPWLGFDNKTALIFELPRIQMDITGNPLESFRIFSYNEDK